MRQPFSTRSFEDTVRAAVIALIIIGILGIGVELVLIGHYDENWQILPLVVLGLGLLATIPAWKHPSRGTLRFFQVVMLTFIVTGVLGIWRHYAGNVEWELERNSDLEGLKLFVESIHGATPILAPGAIAQLGLLGFVFTFRHPALRREQRSTSSEDRS